MKKAKWFMVCLVLGFGPLVAACGDDDDGGGGAADVASEDASSGSGDPGASVADVQACLEAEGWEVERGSSAPEALQEATGLVDHLGITVSGDTVGIGAVTFYEDDDAAEEGAESAALVRTDDVVIERVGTAVYTYVGSGGAADRIGACL